MASELEDLAKRSGSYTDLGEDDSLVKDDIVTFSGSVKNGDEVIRDMQDLQHMVGSYPLLGVEAADVAEKVTGMKVGEVLEIDTTLPDSFTPEEFAGKEAHASLTIQSARRMAAAELNDEIAQRFGLKSLDELKERVSGSIEARKQDEVQTAQSEEILGLSGGRTQVRPSRNPFQRCAQPTYPSRKKQRLRPIKRKSQMQKSTKMS